MEILPGMHIIINKKQYYSIYNPTNLPVNVNQNTSLSSPSYEVAQIQQPADRKQVGTYFSSVTTRNFRRNGKPGLNMCTKSLNLYNSSSDEG
jgi:hypothetical protein